MALYLGSNKVKINLDGKVYYLNLFSKIVITNNDILLSADNYILQDLNGVYLTTKEEI